MRWPLVRRSRYDRLQQFWRDHSDHLVEQIELRNEIISDLRECDEVRKSLMPDRQDALTILFGNDEDKRIKSEVMRIRRIYMEAR